MSSRIDELITQLCPDGVEYKPLSDIATITRGGNLQKKDFIESGVPCIHYGQIYTKYGLFTDKTYTFVSETTASKQKKAVSGDIVMAVTSENIEDVCKCVAWLGDEDVAVSGHTAIIHHNQDAKYLAYYFHSSMFSAQKKKLAHGTKVIEVTPDKLNGVRVPVPPLRLQREIVSLLEKFDQDGLISELQKELELRKIQYEYYRDYLVQCEQEAPTVCVTDICDDIFLGLTSKVDYVREGGVPLVRANNMTSGQLSFDDVRYISLEQHQKLTKNHKAQKGDILVSKSGTLGVVCIVDTDVEFSIYESLICLHPNEKLNSRFLLHLLRSKEVQNKMLEKKVGNAVKHLNLLTFRKLYVKIPSLEKQQRIADILDRLDLICNNINEGIPAEIEARKQQYEYYRDKLLTFKEKT